MRCIPLVILSLATAAALPCSAQPFDAACWHDAASRYRLDPIELAAHACVESRLRTDARNVNADGSEDFTVMQINSRHLPRLSQYGITRAALEQDACLSIHVGAYFLAENKARFGDSWEATGAYNAGCSKLKGEACRKARAAYAWRVYHAMNKLRTTGHC